MRSPATHWTLMLKPGLGSEGVTEKLCLILVSRTKFLCPPPPTCTVGKTPVPGWHSTAGAAGSGGYGRVDGAMGGSFQGELG